MTSVFDVAECILDGLKALPRHKQKKVTAWKLQKLVYYAQAWHLVWDEEPLFEEKIQAWAHGPVCPALYRRHKGSFSISTVKGDASNLSENERETVEVIVDHYGSFSGQELSDLTHSEPPWRDARKGLSPRERGDHVIQHTALVEYYGSLSGEA